MADTFESSFGINIELGFNESQVNSAIRQIYEQAKLLGIPFEDLQEEIKNFGNAFEDIFSKKTKEIFDTLRNRVLQFQGELNDAIANGAGRDELDKLQKKLDKAAEAFARFRDGGDKDYKDNLRNKKNEMLSKAVDNVIPKNVDLLQQAFKRVGTAFVGFVAIFEGTKKVWRFVDAIAQVNMQLRMLHYSSAMAVSSIRGAAGAMALYGSSEQSIAQGATAYNTQIARGKRGLGWGNLQEAGWQWGFIFNPYESYRQRLERAIEHAKTLSETEREAFAQDVDPANAKAIVAMSYQSDAAVKSHFDYADALAQMKTAWGENRVESASRSAREFNEETQRLSQSWKSIKDEISAALLPTMTRLVRAVRRITDFLNEHPQLLYVILGIVGLIGTAVAAVGIIKWVGAIKETCKWLKTALGIMRSIQAVEAASMVMGGAGAAGRAGRLLGGAGRGAGAVGALSAAGGVSGLASVITAGEEAIAIFQRMGQIKMSSMQHDTEMGQLTTICTYIKDWKTEWDLITFGKSGDEENEFQDSVLNTLNHHYFKGDVIDAINQKNKMQEIMIQMSKTSQSVVADGGLAAQAATTYTKIETNNAPITNNNNMEFHINVGDGGNPQATAELCAEVIRKEIKNAALFDSD